jgi:hypothetical protein
MFRKWYSAYVSPSFKNWNAWSQAEVDRSPIDLLPSQCEPTPVWVHADLMSLHSRSGDEFIGEILFIKSLDPDLFMNLQSR